MADSLKNKENTQRVALYIRVSTDDQVEKYGIPLQINSLKSLIESRGKLIDGRPAWQIAGEGNQYIYIDEGISGTIPTDERPAFARLKEDIALAPEGSKPFDIVAVYKIDRFARKLKILLDVIDCFNQYDINFVSANESIDTSTPFGRAMLGIIGIIAELERDTIIARTQQGREEAARSGVAMGNVANYGYKKDDNGKQIILDEEAEIVRQIFSLFLSNESPEKIARRLTDTGVLSPEASAIKHLKRTGNAKNKSDLTYWRADRIRLMLQNEIYVGKQYYNKSKGGKLLPKNEWKIAEYEVPPIIDFLTFEKVQKQWKRMKHEQKNSPSRQHTYLLSGLLKCDCCYDPAKKFDRSNWIGERKKLDNGTYSYYYNCGRKKESKSPVQCPMLSLPGEQIEQYVINQCMKIIQSPRPAFNHQLELRSTKAHRTFNKKKQESILSLIQASENRKKNCKEQHKEGIISTEELKRALAIEDERILNLKNELNTINEELMKESSIEQYALTLELFSKKYADAIEGVKNNRDDLYTLLHTLIDEIVVIGRPVVAEDKVAGKKKANQQIPDAIEIKLRLPQEILSNMIRLENVGSGQEIVSSAG